MWEVRNDGVVIHKVFLTCNQGGIRVGQLFVQVAVAIDNISRELAKPSLMANAIYGNPGGTHDSIAEVVNMDHTACNALIHSGTHINWNIQVH
jgi:hypothetical protein